ncbi:MAG: tetratricopeptide repeat protein, partial [Candidatus Puniceispirillales bacterium]
LNPNNDKAWSYRGAAKSCLSDHDGAMADCDKAIELNPKNAAAWSNRGLAKYHLGRYETVFSVYTEIASGNLRLGFHC